MGVVLAGVKVGSGKDYPLGLVGDAFQPVAQWGGLALFAVLVWGLYAWTARRARAL